MSLPGATTSAGARTIESGATVRHRLAALSSLGRAANHDRAAYGKTTRPLADAERSVAETGVRCVRSTAISSIVLPFGPPLRRPKSSRHWRVAERPIFASLHCLGGASHDYCDDLIHGSTICLEACPGTSIGISGDCSGASGARPDRMAPWVVAFPVLLADLDAMGRLCRSCCCDRLGARACHRPLAARLARDRAGASGVDWRRPDRLRALAL